MIDAETLELLLNSREDALYYIEAGDDKSGKIREYINEVDAALEKEFEPFGSLSIAINEYSRICTWIKDNPCTCVYCGATATEKDHLLPLPWTGKAVRKLVPTVPACRSCNRTLSDFPNPHIYYRCQLIADEIEDARYVILRAGGPSFGFEKEY